MAVNAAGDLPVEAGLALEADLIARCFDSQDAPRAAQLRRQRAGEGRLRRRLTVGRYTDWSRVF
jgi:hypothetical protein